MEVKALEFGGLRFVPYNYEEDTARGLMVTARCTIAPDDQDRLFELVRQRQFLPTTREGIDDTPRPMRLGRCLWSRHGDTIKQEINLVDEEWVDRISEDDDYRPSDDQAQFNARMRELASETAEQVGALVQALTDESVISQEQAKGILAVPEDAIWVRKMSLLRVDDLDEFRG